MSDRVPWKPFSSGQIDSGIDPNGSLLCQWRLDTQVSQRVRSMSDGGSDTTKQFF